MRLKLFTAISFLLVITMLPVACTKTTCGDEFENMTWELKSYGPTDNMQPVVGTNAITIEFNSSDGEISGSGGCNHYFGSYTLKSNCELEISDIGYTEMACMESGVMEQEQKYFSLLQNAEEIEVKNGELRISCGNEVLVYTQ